ncbi:hypothetical protein Aduo_017574 [Ancylostoma duodenale]
MSVVRAIRISSPVSELGRSADGSLWLCFLGVAFSLYLLTKRRMYAVVLIILVNITRVGAAHIPALRPPAPASSSTTTATTTSSASFDLLGLDAPSVPSDLASPAKAMDLFNTPLTTFTSDSPVKPPGVFDTVKVTTGAPTATEPTVNDLLGSGSSTIPVNNVFVADWTAAPSAVQTSVPQPQPAFTAYASTASANPTGSASDIPCDFSAPLSPSRPQIIDSPGKSKTSADEKPTNLAKIGSTWAGASSLIDLDNLASKNTPVKQGVSLNQMQLNKQCANKTSNAPW